MKKVMLLVCLLVSCLYGQDLLNTDSISVQCILNSTKKALQSEAARNPKFKWEIIPTCEIPLDMFLKWNLPNLILKDSKIVSFDGYGGIIWLKEDMCYIVTKTTYRYMLQWWKKDNKNKWTISSVSSFKISPTKSQ